MKKISMKSSKIKVVLTDVDGVLTDGGMYYSTKGDIMKKFHARDGMGVTLLRKNNIPTIIVTKEKNEIIKQWSNKMKIDKLLMGILNKETILEKICKNYDVQASEICYIGDDINDLGLLKLVGFSATPSDGIIEAQKICDYICKNNGGNGVFREVANMILSSQKVKL
ncbi:MAG: 3-deoxy-D-manno-octulosonate 8-phosphate phosphatase [Thaumarchaeota archaeon]|jgi:YrbI family 3-deoxy-D-manno-octulosonate 8-phosphate phosphatase|nr:MAG: 3-deoxy-D-manno-octulosonate 8-phosphate phosphatase [Nitrososphaerota archaeon]